MKITAIEITQHQLPLDPPFNPSWSSRPRLKFDATLVRVHTDQGITGIGSGDYMLGFAGHEHLFIGEDPFHVERHWRVLDHIAFHYGRCWPLDLALWDIVGKAAGQPCWKLLGGLSHRLPCYASSGTLRDGPALADLAQRVLDRGFRAMKIRFRRGDWREDIRALEAVRARIGNRIELMVDCNQGWRFPWDTMAAWTLKDAVTVGRELERLGVYWMEEPLHRADRHGMKKLRDTLDIRVAGGELNREMSELRDVIVEGCLDVVQPDAVSIGGITGLAKVAAMAAAQNITFTPHTWGNGIGLLANAHVVAGSTDASYLEFPWDPPEWTVERRDFMLAAPVDVDADGTLVLSDAPGLGFELDEEALKRTKVDGSVVKSNN
ncbi:MAG: mandelate racemase/muconate lactonizing enzyme family protein [Alphaproteobacteria bacterium]|nr:mandelate racemase/muconate lactonizing enzyme family protein [Alphaproteobacteria bacterium]